METPVPVRCRSYMRTDHDSGSGTMVIPRDREDGLNDLTDAGDATVAAVAAVAATVRAIPVVIAIVIVTDDDSIPNDEANVDDHDHDSG
jgi:hypothetical protein